MSIVEILARYEPLGMYKAGELLLRPSEALRLLSELELLQACVLGVDTWRDVPGGIMETLQSLVLDNAQDTHQRVAHATSFFKDVVPSLAVDWVSFVIDDLR